MNSFSQAIPPQLIELQDGNILKFPTLDMSIWKEMYINVIPPNQSKGWNFHKLHKLLVCPIDRALDFVTVSELSSPNSSSFSLPVCTSLIINPRTWFRFTNSHTIHSRLLVFSSHIHDPLDLIKVCSTTPSSELNFS